MTKRRLKKPKPLTPERAAELKPWSVHLGTANLMIEMSADGGLDSKGKPKPLKRRALSRAALHLLNERPDLLQHPVMLPLLRLMLQKLAIVDPPGAPSSKAVGLAVTMGTLGPNAVSDEQARACMVELTGRTTNAVKQAHNEVKKLRASVRKTGIYLDGVAQGPEVRAKDGPGTEPNIGLDADFQCRARCRARCQSRCRS